MPAICFAKPLWWLRCWVVLCLWVLSPVGATASEADIQILRQARLDTLTGYQEVALPHRLLPSDFPPEGGTVRYRLDWLLPAVPNRPLGVYVSKMALSGRLYINGQLVVICGNGALERLRCLHHPQLFWIPANIVQPGQNTLEFEVYANARQINGLSVVRVGDPEVLYTQFHAWKEFLTLDLQVALAALSMFLGLLSLTVGRILRHESVFTWFGLTSVVNAIASVNGFVVHINMDIDVYNWMIFTFRVLTLPLLFMTLLAVFAKENRRLAHMVMAYVVIAPALIWLSGTHRMVIFALSTPLVCSFPFLFYAAVRWSWQSRSRLHAVCTLMVLILFVGAVFDWLRLAGRAELVGIYPSAYLYSALLVTMGLLLLSRLAAALVQSQKTSALLERQVAERMAYEVTENIPVGTYTVVLRPGESSVHFSFMSRRFLEMLGLEREVLVRHPVAIFGCLHPDDREAWLQRNRDAFARKAPLMGQVRILRDGVVRWITVEAIPRTLPDGSTLWEGVLIDQTEQVLATQTAEKDRALLQEHWLEQSRQEEREQLLRDVHDGFGSQLASVRFMVEKGRISNSTLAGYLQEVSADLHLVVDTLGQPNVTLEDAMYDMRYRTERRFSNSGVQFDWDLALNTMPALSARTILQILRIVQEAMSNAIRHAEPQKIAVTARYQPAQSQLRVSVKDDGKGMPDQPTQGRGMANMRHRAREMDAQWRMSTGPTGSEIEVCLEHPRSA